MIEIEVWKIILAILGTGFGSTLFTSLMNRRMNKKLLQEKDLGMVSSSVDILKNIVEEVRKSFDEMKKERDYYKTERDYYRELLEKSDLNNTELKEQVKILTSKIKELDQIIKTIQKSK